MMRIPRQFAALVLALTSVTALAQTPGVEITATVTDQQGKPLADAVVVAVPVDGNLRLPAKPRDDTVDQVDKQFAPKVTAVAVGTSVFFPNNDNVRHQVYSFSPAKRFELPLYAGVPAQPVVFDKPGVVVLGCNIHDWMVGYIYVSESPYFAKTGRRRQGDARRSASARLCRSRLASAGGGGRGNDAQDHRRVTRTSRRRRMGAETEARGARAARSGFRTAVPAIDRSWPRGRERPRRLTFAPDMHVFLIRRLLAAVPVIMVVTVFVFALLHLAPGDPAAIIAGDLATAEDVAKIRAKLGLDQPLMVQFFTWIGQLLHGDLGNSIFSAHPVSQLIGQRLEPTLTLTLMTLVISILVAVPLGVIAAWRVGSWIDRCVMGFAVFGFSVPVFVIGYVLIWLFAIELDWLPVQGYTPLAQGFWPWLSNIILPSVTLALAYMALIARITRAAMLETLAQDYIRTARAKGLATRQRADAATRCATPRCRSSP